MVDVISMPSANLMAAYLGKEYQPNRPLSNWIRYWQHPGYEIDYLYLKEHLGSDEKGRADIMFSPWMIIRELLSLRGERWYKNEIYRGKLTAEMLEGLLPQEEYPLLHMFLGLAYTRANMWILPEGWMQHRGLYPLVDCWNGDGLGRKTRFASDWGGCCDQMPPTLADLMLGAEQGKYALGDLESWAKRNCLECFFEGGEIEFHHIKGVADFDDRFHHFYVPGFLDAYLRYAIDRIEEREQLLKTAETNGWKL